jgi:hypothetical protein
MQWILKPADCPIPILHTISAMGMALWFYSVDTRTQDEENKFLAIVEEIKQACGALETFP